MRMPRDSKRDRERKKEIGWERERGRDGKRKRERERVMTIAKDRSIEK